MKYADLHAHTSESDGTYTAVELVSEALRRGFAEYRDVVDKR